MWKFALGVGKIGHLMSQELNHLRGPGMAVLLVAVSCLAYSCATAPPAARRTTSPPAAGSPAAGGGASSPAQALPAGGSAGPAAAPATVPQPAPTGSEARTARAEPASAPPVSPEATAPGAPQGLAPAEVSRDLSAFGEAGSWPLTLDGRVLFLRRRPSATQGLDVFAVFAAVPKASDAAAATLSDFSRLFKQDLTPVSFSLMEFHETNGRLERVQSFPLGNHLVFETMKIIPIKKGSDEPFAVSVTFQTQEGSDDVWETFSALGNSQIILQQTLSRSPIIEDIDNDGYLDIIFRERGIEEGTGYETFLTWYKWNGKSFAEYKTTNIVRNLRGFLDRAATLLSENKIAEFLHDSLRGPELARLRSEGKSEKAIFDEVFHLLPTSPDNPNEAVGELSTIKRVIFPNIFENPFPEQSRNGYRFPLTVRFVTSDGASHFYSAKIYMHRNPFVPPEFTFAVGSSTDAR